MKSILASFLVVIFVVFCLSGCNNENSDKELVVFAASSLTESLNEIADVYAEKNPDINLIFNFDSSGTLKTQIEEGAVCDIFISASQTPMDALNCINEECRVDLLENKVVLVVSCTNTKDIQSFEDMTELLNSGDVLMAIGNADVPVGEYSLKIFDYFGLSEEYLNTRQCLTYASNAKEVTTQVLEGSVDCGIVYQTDATNANLKVVDTADKEMCGQVIYPAAVLENSSYMNEAINFMGFLKTQEALKIFEKYGFTTLL